MANKTTKSYDLNGLKFSFDFDTLSELFSNYCNQNTMKTNEAEIKIGEALNVSENTVHSWRMRINAPVDMMMVQGLARLLGAESEMTLLVRKKEGKVMYNLNERQIEAAKRVYDSIVDVLFEAKSRRENFIESISETDKLHISDPEEFEKAWDRYETLQPRLLVDRVKKTLAKEYFDLHDTEIMNLFSVFVDTELESALLIMNSSWVYGVEKYCLAIQKLHTIIGAEYDKSNFTYDPNDFTIHYAPGFFGKPISSDNYKDEPEDDSD